MKKLYLTSSASTVVHKFVNDFDLSNNNKLVFITTGSETSGDDLDWMIKDRQAFIDSGFDVTEYTVTNKSKVELEQYLKDFDYIFVEGGDVCYLLSQSIKSGFNLVIKDLIEKDNRVYIGSSAGSVVAGPTVPSYLKEFDEYGLKTYDCFNFVNFIVVPHWGIPEFKEKYVIKRMPVAYNSPTPSLITLTDEQYIEVVGDSFNIKSI